MFSKTGAVVVIVSTPDDPTWDTIVFPTEHDAEQAVALWVENQRMTDYSFEIKLPSTADEFEQYVMNLDCDGTNAHKPGTCDACDQAFAEANAQPKKLELRKGAFGPVWVNPSHDND